MGRIEGDLFYMSFFLFITVADYKVNFIKTSLYEKKGYVSLTLASCSGVPTIWLMDTPLHTDLVPNPDNAYVAKSQLDRAFSVLITILQIVI